MAIGIFIICLVSEMSNGVCKKKYYETNSYYIIPLNRDERKVFEFVSLILFYQNFLNFY